MILYVVFVVDTYERHSSPKMSMLSSQIHNWKTLKLHMLHPLDGSSMGSERGQMSGRSIPFLSCTPEKKSTCDSIDLDIRPGCWTAIRCYISCMTNRHVSVHIYIYICIHICIAYILYIKHPENWLRTRRLMGPWASKRSFLWVAATSNTRLS